MKRSLLARRVVAGAGVAAVVLAGFAGATAASAAIDNPTKYDTLAAVKTAATTPVVKFHKYEGNPALDTTGNVDGQPATVTGTAISGVQFTLTPILCGGAAPNLLTQDGWNDIAGLKADLEKGNNKVNSKTCTKATTGVITTGETDTNGVTTVDSGLTHTAYLVSEVANTKISTTTPDFILTLPSRTVDHKWINEVNLYPKNIKATDDASKVAGAPVGVAVYNGTEVTTDTYLPWTVTATVPSQGADAVKAFWLDDPIPANQEIVTTGDYSPTAKVGTADATLTLYQIPAANEECWNATDGYTGCTALGTEKNNVRFAVNVGVNPYKPAVGDKVTIKFYTKVKQSAIDEATNAGLSLVNDKAKIYVNGKDATGGTGYLQDKTDPTKPTTPSAVFANLNMLKVAKGSTTTKLDNAKFDVYVADSSVTTTVPDTTVKAKKLTATEFVTGTDGAFANKLVVADGDYYFVETQAPAGYQTPASGAYVKVTVEKGKIKSVAGTNITASNASTGADTATDASDDKQIVQVENVRGALDPTLGLPITGAQGLMLLTIGGLVIIAAGVGVLVAVRRRQAAAE